MPFPRGGKLTKRQSNASPPSTQEDTLFPTDLSHSSTPKPRSASSTLQGLTARKRRSKRSNSSGAAGRSSKRARADAQVYQLLQGGLRAGLLVYGVVKQVGERYAVVSLANNISGILSIERVSDFLPESAAMPDLLHPGNFVRCAIIAAKRTEQGGMRVELSMQASVVNKGMTSADLADGALVFGNVKSREDHGFLIGLGIGKMTAFLRYEDAGCSAEAPCFKVGEPVEAKVMSLKKPVVISVDEAVVRDAVMKTSKKTSFSSIRPGCLVTAKLTAVLKNGIKVSFLGSFTGFIHSLHLTEEMLALSEKIRGVGRPHDGEDGIPQNLKPFPARVIFVDVENKGIGLSMAKHLVKREKMFQVLSTIQGHVFQKAKITAIEQNRGIYVNLPLEEASNGAVPGFIPASNVAEGDRKVPCERFKVGQSVAGRCTDLAHLDGCAHLSMLKKVITAEVLTYKDLSVGQEITAEVLRLQPYGLLVQMGHRLKALIPTLHFGDVEVRNPQKRFKPGTKLKAKVLSIRTTEEGARVQLTLKKSLLRSKLKIIEDVDDVEIGDTAHGFVSSLREKQGVHVTFYNGVHGLIGLSDLNAFGVEDMNESYKVGQVLLVRVVGKSPTKQALRLSLRTSGTFSSASSSTAASAGPFKIGQLVTGKVVRRQKTGALLVRVKSLSGPTSSSLEATAILPVAHCSDHPDLAPALAKQYFSPGRAIHKAVVVKAEAEGMVTISVKPLLVAVSSRQDPSRLPLRVPKSLGDVHEDEMLSGVVSKVTSLGVFVEFLGGLTALAPRANVADVWVSDPSSFFSVGQTVLCRVVHLQQSQNKFIVSLKASVIAKADLTHLPRFFLRSLLEEKRLLRTWKRPAGDIEVGSKVSGEVVEMKEYGVAVNLKTAHGECLAFGMKENLGSNGPQLGDEVTCRVLDAESEVVDVSMRPSIVNTEMKRPPESKTEQSNSKRLDVTVELVKPEYSLVFVPTLGCLGLVPTKSYNGQLPGLDGLKVGIRCKASAVQSEEGSETRDLPVFQIHGDGGLRQKRSRSRSESITSPERKEITKGEVLRVQVRDISPVALSLTLLNVRRRKRNKGSIAQIHCCDATDSLEDGKPVFDGISVGAIFDAKVADIDRDGARMFVHMSTKESDLSTDGEPPAKTFEVSPGGIYTGIVSKVVKDGVVVALSRSKRGFIFCTRLSDDISYLERLFNQGDETCKEKLIGRAMKVRALAVDDESGHIDLAPLSKSDSLT